MSRKRWLPKVLWSAVALIALSIPGCGGSDSPSQEEVKQTKETVLVVEGVSYQRTPPPIGEFAPGQVLVKPVAGRELELQQILQKYSLSIYQTGALSLVISVPVGFEWQWVQALHGFQFVEYAELNGLAHPV
jgi:hypothetical protein